MAEAAAEDVKHANHPERFQHRYSLIVLAISVAVAISAVSWAGAWKQVELAKIEAAQP